MSLVARYNTDQRRRGHTPASVRRTADDLCSYLRSVGDPLTAAAEDVEIWLEGRGQAPRTRYNLISGVSAFYQWLIREGLVTADPTTNVPRPRLRRYLPRPITDADLAYALRVAPPLMKAWLSLMAYAGLRCQEVAGVDAGDLLWHLDPPKLVVTHAKGGNERMVPVASDAELALRSYGVPRHGPVFLNGKGRSFSPAAVSQRVNTYLADVGVDATAHQLRHWFGSNVYQQTLDLRATQELLGHASPTSTSVYTAFAPGAAGGVVRDLRVSPDHPVFHQRAAAHPVFRERVEVFGTVLNDE